MTNPTHRGHGFNEVGRRLTCRDCGRTVPVTDYEYHQAQECDVKERASG